LFVVEVNRATAITRAAELLDLKIGYKDEALARSAKQLAHVGPAQSEMHGYDQSIALDLVVAIHDAGQRRVYAVAVGRSQLIVAVGAIFHR
jgi:hypothetical protein